LGGEFGMHPWCPIGLTAGDVRFANLDDQR
jgi:hypothetical protein